MSKKLLVALFFISTSVFSAPKQFDDISTLISDLNDYPTERGQFKIIKEKPLSIQISPEIFQGDSKGVIDALSNKAAIYATYRTLFQTPATSVNVTVIPVAVDFKTNKKVYLDNQKISFKIDREKALAIAKKFSDIKSADDIMDGNTWNESFQRCCYLPEGNPGNAKIIKLFSSK